MTLHPDRQQHVGASECAALWSLGWETRYRLWARKLGLLPHDGEDAEILQIGRYLEPAVAELVTAQTAWALRKVHRYVRHKTIEGMAASPDYEILVHPNGPGLLEIKTVDSAVFARWNDQPPIQYELQLQHQLACANRGWGALAILVSNRKLHLFERQREEAVIAKIEAEIPRFWEEVRERREPEDAPADVSTTLDLYRTVYQGEIADLSLDAEAQSLAERYAIAAAAGKQAKLEQDTARAGLLRKMGGAMTAYLPDGKISSWAVAEGTYTATRKAYRAVRISVNTIEPVEEVAAT